MPDDTSPLPWTTQQWTSLRAVVQESARKSRVASTFLPLAGPLPTHQATVPSNWMALPQIDDLRERGEAEQRLEVISGKTLHLTTISCNVYLRGSEVADPELEAAKSMLRRAAEVLGRLEDAIVFNGLPDESISPYPMRDDGSPIVQPPIYTISGGRDQTGLLQAPLMLLASLHGPDAADPDLTVRQHLEGFRSGRKKFRAAVKELRLKTRKDSKATQQERTDARDAVTAARTALDARTSDLEQALEAAARSDDFMSVSVGNDDGDTPIVGAVVRAIEKLEHRGHFGPFAAIFGHTLFSEATRPAATSLVLPTDRFVPFLDGGPFHRSSTLPDDEGVVIALGGRPIELVLGSDMDVRFLQVTLEPRYVLRVFERFVLRIKELDAVCRITRGSTARIAAARKEGD